MAFFLQTEAGPANTCNWKVQSVSSNGVDVIPFESDVMTLGSADRYFTVESIYETNNTRRGGKLRRIRTNTDGKYLTWEKNVNGVGAKEGFGFVATPLNTNERWEIVFGQDWNNKYRFILRNVQHNVFVSWGQQYISAVPRLVGSATQTPNCHLLMKPRIFQHPYTYFIRSDTGRVLQLNKQDGYPWVRYSTNKLTWETFSFMLMKLPDIYAIYCPYHNAFLAIDPDVLTMGWRDNTNGYNPAAHDEALFRILYLPETLPATSGYTNPTSYSDTFGKFRIQTLKGGFETPGPPETQVGPHPYFVPSKGYACSHVSGQYPFFDGDAWIQEQHCYELLPTGFGTVGPSMELPPLDRNPSN